MPRSDPLSCIGTLISDCTINTTLPVFAAPLIVAFGAGATELADFVGTGSFPVLGQLGLSTSGPGGGNLDGTASGLFSGDLTVEYSYVPEPSTGLLLAAGLAGLALGAGRRRENL